MQVRYYQLDTMRGLAALAVVIHHCLMIPSSFDTTTLAFLLNKTPMGIIQVGGEAVAIFFILSGFVLALPFLERPVPYGQYMVKRVCRIWLPYMVAVIMAIILVLTVSRGRIPELGDWFNSTWTTPITTSLVMNHVFLIGAFNTDTLNGPFWSLVHEMRVSIIFPFIPLLVIRFSYKKTIPLAIFLMAVGMLLSYFLWSKMGVYANFFLTVNVIGLFIIGALIAKERQAIINWFSFRSYSIKVSLLVISILLFTVNYWTSLIYSQHIYGESFVKMWFYDAGAALLLIIAISSTSLTRILTWRPLHFLGLISFSIYLLHANVLWGYVHLLYQKIPMWQIWLLTIATTILLATISYYLVERPSIKLGHYLANKIYPQSGAIKSTMPNTPK